MFRDIRRGLWKKQDTILQIKNSRRLVNGQNIYNIAVIVDYRLVVGVKQTRSRFSHLPTIRFVSNQPEIEECYNLAPVIKSLRDNADLLNAFFIDNEK